MGKELSNVAVMDRPADLLTADEISETPNFLSSKSEIAEDTFDKYILSVNQMRFLILKRFFDFLISFISLFVLLIPFVMIVIIQKIVSPKEPVFFNQIRIGKDGVPFKLTKFRSMKSTAPHDCPTKDFSDGCQYITKWGRFLRDTSIDELPQLFQVITGKMSLVGPRPLIPQEDRVHQMREQAGIYQLRPGMTGWAQINGRDLVEDMEKVKLDRAYLEKVGIKIDIIILFKTFFMVFKKTDIVEGKSSTSVRDIEYK